MMSNITPLFENDINKKTIITTYAVVYYDDVGNTDTIEIEGYGMMAGKCFVVNSLIDGDLVPQFIVPVKSLCYVTTSSRSIETPVELEETDDEPTVH